VPILIAFAAAVAAAVAQRRLRRARSPARLLIVSPPKSTVIAQDGAVRSVQSARLTLPERELDRLWSPVNLENLGSTYWRFLSRVTLRLIRVVYSERERAVVLLGAVTLLRFDAPDYVLERMRGQVRWRIKDGLLVSRAGRGSGWLSLSVARCPPRGDPGAVAEVTIEVEVANFYPSIASGFSTFVYEITQAFVHVLVTHAFLRSLASLQLAESKVRRFRPEPGEPAGAENTGAAAEVSRRARRRARGA
jgi:hypothetical protein